MHLTVDNGGAAAGIVMIEASRLPTPVKSGWSARWAMLIGLVLSLCACSSTPGAEDAAGGEVGLDLVASDLGGPDVGLRPDLHLPTPTDLRGLSLYVNMGDSIAAGFGIGRGLSYSELLLKNADEEYPSQVGKDLATLVGPGKVSRVSVARSGATSDDLVGQLRLVPGESSGDTLVTISAGGNDLLNSYDLLLSDSGTQELAAKVFDNLLAIKTHFSDSSRYGKVTIVIFNVYDPTDNTGMVPQDADVNQICGLIKTVGKTLGPLILANLSAYNDGLRRFAAEQGFLLADIRTAFLGHGFNHQDQDSPYYDSNDPSLWFMRDCIHPTYAGHDGLRRLLWAMLTGQ